MSLVRIGNHLILLPRFAKKSIVLFVDIALCVLATWLSFSLRFDVYLVPINKSIYLAALTSIFFAVPIFIRSGLYRAIFRYANLHAAVVTIKAITVYGIFYFLFFIFVGIENVPRSIGLIQPIILLLLIGVSRVFAKFLLNKICVHRASKNKTAIALIYGAGASGQQIAFGLDQSSNYELLGFLDDDHKLWNGTINGLPVYPPESLPQLLSAGLGITDILLSPQDGGLTRQREILNTISELPVRVKLLPTISDLANGKINVNDIRSVEIDDVLGRDSVLANESLLNKNIANKVVLVTGAGGSIGSELCRQIIEQKPRTLILYELSEFALYTIHRELMKSSELMEIIPILGSVLDFNKFSRILVRFGVHTVYHAAAYKHVSMVEINPAAGVWNNIFGTLRIVEASCQHEVETFVLVSSDKAVRPTNVMGCTKRVSELVLQAKNGELSKLGSVGTKLTMVRFGNVLGSSGSVVPIFLEQIQKGGPVTITHPDVIRYFMTIPEAAQLVIQAGAIGEGGDVMVLDMGSPVKIIDLAKKMIHLSGLSYRDEKHPNGDVEIKFTGLRPGEKLYEELLIGDHTIKTPHPQIMRAIEHQLSWEILNTYLADIEIAVKNESNVEILTLLKKIVPEFNHQLN